MTQMAGAEHPHAAWWRTSRVWWLVAVGAALVTLVIVAIVETLGPAPMPYSEFLDQIDAGNVASVIFRGTEIDGRFKHPLESAASNGTRQGDIFVSRVPDFGDPNLIPELRKQHVTIDVTSSSSWTRLLLGVPLPMWLFLGAILIAGIVRLVRGRKGQSGSAMPMHPMQGMMGLLSGLFAKQQQGEGLSAQDRDEMKRKN